MMFKVTFVTIAIVVLNDQTALVGTVKQQMLNQVPIVVDLVEATDEFPIVQEFLFNYTELISVMKNETWDPEADSKSNSTQLNSTLSNET